MRTTLIASAISLGGRGWAAGLGLSGRLHRDQGGTISILTVFAVLLLTMLLGMVMNVGRHADGKIRMQNAADAAAYSGGVVMARGMNTLAFTNHLLCDVFAVTAFMREARDRNAEPYVPGILAAWARIGPVLAGSGFPKFERLGRAITEKVPLEQQAVTTYSQWAAAASERILPLMEYILQGDLVELDEQGQPVGPDPLGGLIPQFQRAVVQAIPDIAQMATMETARRNGWRSHGRGPMLGALWQTSSAMPVGSYSGNFARTVVDPVDLTEPETYRDAARRDRRRECVRYLARLNRDAMYFFDHRAKMCQFGGLWRVFTCGYLNQLLEEYRWSNLPHLIRSEDCPVCSPREDDDSHNSYLAESFTLLGVVYWQQLPERLPGLFWNPAASHRAGDYDAVAYAEVRLFAPRLRLVWRYHDPHRSYPIGGVPGEFPDLPPDDGPEDPDAEGYWFVGHQCCMSQWWDLWNQHWTAQLVPATQPNLATILQTVPPLPEFGGAWFDLPDLGALDSQSITQISPH